MRARRPVWAAMVPVWALVGVGRAATLSVGPGQPYATPCAAIAAAADGDTIEIAAAGSYAGDVCAWSKNGLTLRGVGGRAHVDAAGQNAQGKAIWVISGKDTTVENIELSGAQVPDRNGAGIRQEGDNLTLRGCYFHDNEDGILTGASPTSDIVIEGSELARNGAGDGFSHNLYIGQVRSFTLRFSYSHAAKIGHEVKSRARENHILYNRISDEAGGTASYAVDLPNAGTSFVIGNVIEQGPHTDNPAIIAYGLEGASNPRDDLYVVNNTVVNDLGRGTFITVGRVATPAVVRNNVFFGGGTVIDQPGAQLAGNFTGDPLLVDRAGYDYQLRPGSPCIDQGVDPGSGAGVSLAPVFAYRHPAMGEPRAAVGAIDIGAYELGVPADGGLPAIDAAIDDAAAIADTASIVAPDAAVVTRDVAGATASLRAGCGCHLGGRAEPPAFAALVVVAISAARGRGRRRDLGAS